MKKGIIVIVILLIFVIFFFLNSILKNVSKLDVNNIKKEHITIYSEISEGFKEVPVNKEKSILFFTVYAPEEFHQVFFDEWEGSFLLRNGEIKGFKERINASSLRTKTENLDLYLKVYDFFDIEDYPEIRFESTDIYNENDKKIIKGRLTLKGISKEISFPIEASKNFIYGDYLINMESFDLNSFFDKYMRITFFITK